MVALKLEEELLSRGYRVIMVRTTHDVNISNSERAQVANDAGADAFVRIHANGSENTSIKGAMTICQTAANPYNGDLYQQSKDHSGNGVRKEARVGDGYHERDQLVSGARYHCGDGLYEQPGGGCPHGHGGISGQDRAGNCKRR